MTIRHLLVTVAVLLPTVFADKGLLCYSGFIESKEHKVRECRLTERCGVDNSFAGCFDDEECSRKTSFCCDQDECNKVINNAVDYKKTAAELTPLEDGRIRCWVGHMRPFAVVPVICPPDVRFCSSREIKKPDYGIPPREREHDLRVNCDRLCKHPGTIKTSNGLMHTCCQGDLCNDMLPAITETSARPVPSMATVTPSVTDGHGSSEAPGITDGKPPVTPSATDSPISSEAPGITDAKPPVTPSVTNSPTSSEAPGITDANPPVTPSVTDSPTSSEAPGITDVKPSVTPSVTDSPTSSEASGITEGKPPVTPSVTDRPTSSEALGITGKKPAVTSLVTDSPTSSEAPEVTNGTSVITDVTKFTVLVDVTTGNTIGNRETTTVEVTKKVTKINTESTEAETTSTKKIPEAKPTPTTTNPEQTGKITALPENTEDLKLWLKLYEASKRRKHRHHVPKMESGFIKHKN